MRVALTDLAVKNLKPPSKGQRIYYDRALSGFGVRVSQAGTRTFTLIHGLDRRLVTLGRYPTISLAQARDKARRLLAEKVLGLDRLVPTPTFAEAFELFKQTYNPPRDRTKQETVRIIAKHLLPRFGSRRIGEITTPEVAAVIDKLLSKPGAANHVYAAARLIFRWTWRRRMIDRSPLDGLPFPARYVPRERVLSDDELRSVFRAAGDGSIFGTMIQLLILTGQRKGQIVNLRREHTTRRPA
jgi:integrase